MQKKTGVLLVNFGGPRSIDEIRPFLTELLTDTDVIRTSLPSFLHRLLFKRIAKKRSKKVAHDYELIGGKSPIFEDTEAIAERLRSKLRCPVLTFHRYLPGTHAQFVSDMKLFADCESVRVFPMFPQFSYTTTGSIARWFAEHLCKKTVEKFRWIKSYPEDPGFIEPFQAVLQKTLEENQFSEEETFLLFSAHGLPKSYISTGDPYQGECESSFKKMVERFPRAAHRLCYQSLFGKEEWIRPYTAEFCEELGAQVKSYRNVVVVPLSFTSDHIETLFEIEQQYLPILKAHGFNAVRCPAMNRKEEWIDGIAKIISSSDWVSNGKLVRGR